MSTPKTTPKNMARLWTEHRRICNLVPGLTRIWRLGEVRDELQISIDMGEVHPDSVERIEALILYIERLQYDLLLLNAAANGRTLRDGRPMTRNDPNHWIGERP